MDSIVTKFEGICAITGKRATCKHHLVFGRGFRELAEKDGLWIPLIDEVHNMGKVEQDVRTSGLGEAPNSNERNKRR